MPTNVHTPERRDGESFEAFRARRHASRRAAQAITLTGRHAPGQSTSRKTHRDSLRESGGMSRTAGSYGRGLRNNITRKQAAARA